LRTVADPNLLRRVLVEWTQDRSAFLAVETDVFELRKHASAASDDARDTDQTVKMRAPKVTESRSDGEVGDADVDLSVDPLIVRVVYENGLERDLVKYV
jgi:hypothetical protein